MPEQTSSHHPFSCGQTVPVTAGSRTLDHLMACMQCHNLETHATQTMRKAPQACSVGAQAVHAHTHPRKPSYYLRASPCRRPLPPSAQLPPAPVSGGAAARTRLLPSWTVMATEHPISRVRALMAAAVCCSPARDATRTTANGPAHPPAAVRLCSQVRGPGLGGWGNQRHVRCASAVRNMARLPFQLGFPSEAGWYPC